MESEYISLMCLVSSFTLWYNYNYIFILKVPKPQRVKK